MSDIIIASKREAEDRAERIRTALSVSWDLIKDAWKAFDWQALGYESWDAYCDGEFGTSRIRLPREERREVVSSMREIGMPIRAIASATGTNRETVRQEVAGDKKLSPETVTGMDGKTYSSSQPERPRATAMPQSDLDALNTPPATSPDEPVDDDPEPPHWEPAGQMNPAATEALRPTPAREPKPVTPITVPAEDETEKDRLLDLMTHLRKAEKEIKEALFVAHRLDAWDQGPVTYDLRRLLNDLDNALTTGGMDAELATLLEGDQK